MLNDNENEILEFIRDHPGSSSREIYEDTGILSSYATVKRILSNLMSMNLVEVSGQGKGTRYYLSPAMEILQSIDIEDYFQHEIDERVSKEFNLQRILTVLYKYSVFQEAEMDKLHVILQKYQKNISFLSTSEYHKELDRLAIDLSWKSSQIEGNTYSLLETERLLLEKETAAGKTKDEAIMLLNHKDTIDFIINNPGYLAPLTVSKIEDIHSMLVKELDVARNIRNKRIGISGTNYRPLENEYLIYEALEAMCDLINHKANTFEKALLALALISYIQPFMDGNKRTARIVSNAILMNDHYCPLSFRTVSSADYKKAMLIFYEQNNIHPIKGIFIKQFEFAVNTYF
ncbi:MAG: Fic family protein [Bacteroidales bacterium]